MINIFMSENWFQSDPNYQYNLKVALTVQDTLVELRDLLSKKSEMIKSLQKSNDPRLTFSDFEEEKRLQKQIQDFSGNFDPFSIINSNPKL